MPLDVAHVDLHCEGSVGRAVLTLTPAPPGSPDRGGVGGECYWMIVPDGVAWVGDGTVLRDTVLGRRAELSLKYKRVIACSGVARAQAAGDPDPMCVRLRFAHLQNRHRYVLLAAYVAPAVGDTASVAGGVCIHPFTTPRGELQLKTLGYVGLCHSGAEAVFATRAVGCGWARCGVYAGDVRGEEARYHPPPSRSPRPSQEAPDAANRRCREDTRSNTMLSSTTSSTAANGGDDVGEGGMRVIEGPEAVALQAGRREGGSASGPVSSPASASASAPATEAHDPDDDRALLRHGLPSPLPPQAVDASYFHRSAAARTADAHHSYAAGGAPEAARRVAGGRLYIPHGGLHYIAVDAHRVRCALLPPGAEGGPMAPDPAACSEDAAEEVATSTSCNDDTDSGVASLRSESAATTATTSSRSSRVAKPLAQRGPPHAGDSRTERAAGAFGGYLTLLVTPEVEGDDDDDDLGDDAAADTEGAATPTPASCLFDLHSIPALCDVRCVVAAADAPPAARPPPHSDGDDLDGSSDGGSDATTAAADTGSQPPPRVGLRVRGEAGGPGVLWCVLLRAASPVAWHVNHRKVVALVRRVGFGGSDAPLLRVPMSGGVDESDSDDGGEGGIVTIPNVAGGGDVIACGAFVQPAAGAFELHVNHLLAGAPVVLLLLPASPSGFTGLHGIAPAPAARPTPVHRQLLLLPDAPSPYPTPAPVASPAVVTSLVPTAVSPTTMHVKVGLRCGPARELPVVLMLAVVPVNSFDFPNPLRLAHLVDAPRHFPGGHSEVRVVCGSGPHTAVFPTLPGIHYKVFAAWETEGYEAFRGERAMTAAGGDQCCTAMAYAPDAETWEDLIVQPLMGHGSQRRGTTNTSTNSSAARDSSTRRARKGGGFVDSWREGRPRPKSAGTSSATRGAGRKRGGSGVLGAARTQVTVTPAPFSTFVEWRPPSAGAGGAKAAAVPPLPRARPLPTPGATTSDNLAHRVPTVDAVLEVRRLFASTSRDRATTAEWIPLADSSAGAGGPRARVVKSLRVARTPAGLARFGHIYRTALRHVNHARTTVRLPVHAPIPNEFLPCWLDLLDATESNIATEPWRVPWTVFLVVVFFDESHRPVLRRMRRVYDTVMADAIETGADPTLHAVLGAVAGELLEAQARVDGGESLREAVHETSMLFNTALLGKGSGRFNLSAAMGAGSDAHGFAPAFAESTFSSVVAALLFSRADLVKLTRGRAVSNGPLKAGAGGAWGGSDAGGASDSWLYDASGECDHMAVQCLSAVWTSGASPSPDDVPPVPLELVRRGSDGRRHSIISVGDLNTRPNVTQIYQGTLARNAGQGKKTAKARTQRLSIFNEVAGR